MKKAYSPPRMEWIPIRPQQPVANPCWSHANSGTPLYHDVPGRGYCQIMLSKKGCGKAEVVGVQIMGAEGMTSQEKAAAEAWMMDHLAEKLAASGNNMAPFKGSGFETSPDPDWS